MKILFVAHERNMGGASKSLVTLAQELKARGHQVTVVLPIKTGQVYAALKSSGIEVKHVFFGWWMEPAGWNPLMKFAFRILYALEWIPERRIAALARKKDVQIIHSNSSVIDVGARAAKRAGIMHVWHFREFGDADYRLEFLKGVQKSCAYVETVPGKVVFISQSVGDYYAGRISKTRGCVIYNGISEKFLFDKYQTEIRQEKNTGAPVVFLIAGNLHPAKRQDLAIEACGILKKRGVTNFRLIIAGAASVMRDSRQFEKKLREMAAKDLESEITFTGFVSDMAELRKTTDVELVCSEKEAFGRVTIEAMMASDPVIASDSGANPELIRPGENGLLFESGNAKALADCMQELIAEPGRIENMGRQAFRFAGENFLSDRNTEQIEALYRKLTEESSTDAV